MATSLSSNIGHLRSAMVTCRNLNLLLRPRIVLGAARSNTQFRPSSSRTVALHQSKSSWQIRPTAMGILTSLAYSSLSITTTTALCDTSGNSNTNNDGGDDQDFISKIRSILDSQSFPLDLENNQALNSILSSMGGQVSTAISSGIPTDLSYGFFAGYFSGLALKKIGKVASITLGISFLALQTLAYNGYIEVHHEKLQKEVEQLFDRNGDGVVDGQDIKSALEEVRKVAGFGLEDKNLVASGGGFGMGFWGGLRSG